MRYRTRNYITEDETEARRLAAIDGTPVDAIKVDDTSLVHRGTLFALWDDGLITEVIGLDEKCPKSLSADAETIIDAAYGSDSGLPECIDIIKRIARIKGVQVMGAGPDRTPYGRATIEKLDCVLVDGSEVSLYRFMIGYFEGYAYEVADSMERLMEIIS